MKEVHSHIFFHGKDTTDTYLLDPEFFEVTSSKPTRLTSREVTETLVILVGLFLEILMICVNLLMS